MQLKFYATDTDGDERFVRGMGVKARPNLRREAKSVLEELAARDAQHPGGLVPDTLSVRAELSEDYTLIAAETWPPVTR